MAEDIMNKMLSFLAGTNDVGSDRQVLLKQTAKDLGQNKYAKFFRYKTEEADPSLAAFFYNIYRMTFPIRVFMQDQGKMAALRQKVVEVFMEPALRETVSRLSEEAVAERAASVTPQELTAQIQADLSKLVAGFDRNKVDRINRVYNLAALLSQLVGYNFPSILKKFDPAFAAGNFSVEPKFTPVKVELILRDLADFLSVSHAISPEGDWKNLLVMLRSCAGQDLTHPDLFIQLINNVRDVCQSKILEQIVQFTLKNPVWEWKPKIPEEHAVETWLEAKKNEAKNSINKIAAAQKNVHISALVKQVFNTTDLVRLENYTVDKAEIYRKKNLEDFVYARGLNYLQAFLGDYVDREIRELCDILLVRGQWTINASSKEMSEALHRLQELPPQIQALDETMAEEGSDGSRLKAAMLRVDRDKTQIRYINSIIGNNNDEALEFISSAAQELIVIGKHLKSLVEDIQKKPPDLIINWRELNLVSRTPLAQRMADDCKRINYFVQLLKLCT
jgi:hypothetical protein